MPLRPEEQDLGRRGLLPLLILLAACAAPPDTGQSESSESTTEAITNGATDDGDPAVVALLGLSGAYCSGTLVTPYIVVTAGHCTTPAPKQVFFGTDPKGAGTTIDVAEAHHHPSFNSGSLANDIGIVALKERAPAAPVNRVAAAPTVGEAIRIVGFGAASTTDFTLIKRVGNSKVDKLKDTAFDLGPEPSQTCNGDSGGAAFDGAGALMGVTSEGDLSCATFGRDMRVEVYADFIDSEIAAYKPPAPPADDSGCGASGRAPSSSLWLLVAAVVLLRRSRCKKNGQSGSSPISL